MGRMMVMMVKERMVKEWVVMVIGGLMMVMAVEVEVVKEGQLKLPSSWLSSVLQCAVCVYWG